MLHIFSMHMTSRCNVVRTPAIAAVHNNYYSPLNQDWAWAWWRNWTKMLLIWNSAPIAWARWRNNFKKRVQFTHFHFDSWIFWHWHLSWKSHISLLWIFLCVLSVDRRRYVCKYEYYTVSFKNILKFCSKFGSRKKVRFFLHISRVSKWVAVNGWQFDKCLCTFILSFIQPGAGVMLSILFPAAATNL